MHRIGLLGCGSVANYGHLPAIRSIPDLDLVAVYDPDPKRAESAARDFNVPRWYANADDFFQSDMEAVAVTSMAPAHRQNILDAARYGKHALCEKPLALDDADAEEMIEAMRKAGLMLFTGFCYRFSPSAIQIKQLVAAGAIGDVRSLRLIYIWNNHGKYAHGPDGIRILNQARVGRMVEGGPMIDCGAHQIDLARWWLESEPVQIIGAGSWTDNYEAPDHMYLHMDHMSGAHTMVEISYSYTYTARDPRAHFLYELIGSEGIIRYERENQSFELRNATGTHWLNWHHEKNFYEMYRAYAHALSTGDCGYLPSGEDGLVATRIAREATLQAIANRRVPASGRPASADAGPALLK